MTEQLENYQERIVHAIRDWLAWLPTWKPSASRGRSRMCRRCVGSPVLSAAGLNRGTPHQVAHALNMRVQRIIDSEVDSFTLQELPFLSAELAADELWRSGGSSAAQGLPPELDGLDLDPEPEEDQPYLFTFADLADQPGEFVPLPRPPLSESEKVLLRAEIGRADAKANELGSDACFVLLQHQEQIAASISRFVEPQIQVLLERLVQQLDAPREL